MQQASDDAVPVAPVSHDLILLKGAPGVGKSSAAKELARHFGSSVRIEVDDLRKMVVRVKWTDQVEHRKVLTLGAQLASGFLRSGFAPVILVDTFSGDKIDDFLSEVRSGCPHARVFVAVLHASEEVLRDRVANRDADGFRDLTVSLRLNHQAVHELRPFERLIDTTDLSPADVVQTILNAMCGSEIR
jgi:predicted kinase